MVTNDRKLKKGPSFEGEKPRINLGLSELVASLNPGPQAEPSVVPSENPAQISATPDPTFEGLADKKDWKSLSSFAQQRMTSLNSAESIVATIWWGIANLETGDIPSAILSTPVSKASSEIERFACSPAGSLVQPGLNSSRLKKETASLLVRLAKKNLGALSDKSIPEFLVRAVKLDNTLTEELISLIDRECDRLSKMTGRKNHREERLIALKDARKACEELKEKPLNIEPKSSAGAVKVVAKPKSSYNKFILSTAAFGIVLYLGFYFFGSQSLFNREDSIGVAAFADVAVDANLVALQSDRIKTVDNLEVLLSKVNSLAVPKVTQGPSEMGRHNSTLEKVDLTQSPPSKGELSGSREKIDTSGPVEGTVFYGNDRRREDSPAPSVFGNEPPGVGGLIPEGSSGRGSSNSGVYRVLTYTRVYSKASYFSQTIANLDSGSRVQVVDKFGEWLKIRSKGGQVGFMLAQDAELVE